MRSRRPDHPKRKKESLGKNSGCEICPINARGGARKGPGEDFTSPNAPDDGEETKRKDASSNGFRENS